MKDRLGRDIRYLRLSVTKMCNLNCTYCGGYRKGSALSSSNAVNEERHKGGKGIRDKESSLSLKEITFLLRAFSMIGVEKVRITGGEPLLRPDILDIVKIASQTEGIKEVCLTTNGVLFYDIAPLLYEVGIRHINISLDTMSPEKFRHISGKNAFYKVIKGIERAIDIGFSPIKINTVLIRGINDDELTDFAKLTLSLPVEWRFIEFMPIGENKWERFSLITVKEARDRIETHFGNLEEVYPPNKWHGPARLFRIKGAKGLIGFISPMSQHFCKACNRLRITPDAALRLCLFSDNEVDLRGKMQAIMSKNKRGATIIGYEREWLYDENGYREFVEYLKGIIYQKPVGPVALKKTPQCLRPMQAIGG